MQTSSYGRPNKGSTCLECGQFFPWGEREAYYDHMVNDHKYTRIGNSVYKRKTCALCSKNALYKVGMSGYCKDHYKEAEQRRMNLNSMFLLKSEEIQGNKKAGDYKVLAKVALKSRGFK